MANVTQIPANVLASAAAQKERGIAGASITAGMPLYKDSSDSDKLKPAQATSTKSGFVGLALNGAASGQPVEYVTRDTAFEIGGTVAVGTVYGLSATAGAICPVADWTSGDYGVVIGIGTTTAKISTLADTALRAGAAKA